MRTFPSVLYNKGVTKPLNIYVSRSSTVNQLHWQICEFLYTQSQDKHPEMSALFLKKYSRLWRFGNTDDFDSVKSAFSQAGGVFPIEVHGKILESEE